MSCDACVHDADRDGRLWVRDVDLCGCEDARCLRERLQCDADMDRDRRVWEHSHGHSDDQCGGYGEADDLRFAWPDDD